MAWIILILSLVCVSIPLCFSWRVWNLNAPTLLVWFLLVAEAAAFVALIMLVGRWDIAGSFTRYALCAVFAATVLVSAWRHRIRPWRIAGARHLRARWPAAVSVAFFGGALLFVAGGLLPPAQQAKSLAFPLKDGRFMVVHGGGIGLLNHHAGHKAQRFALDVNAVDATGFRASGVLPSDLDRYAVFGAAIISPCAGRVVAARDDLPDLIPPKADRDNARGNHVIIDCGDVNVELAHMRKGSVRPAGGAMVKAGEVLGQVGNSGNTTEPHLHIHAVGRDGKGVPISFAGTNPVRNRLYLN